ncbi:hypothetical protein [Mesotoga sp. H07.pep.5.3]|uniref:hypothetical protein n=1 Tax=Mesotoga sp. H07.pep.5.3 TaxID=1421003 RepID=UPI000C18C262|nr:hypothetical protein [Mesotoga sp. H07.pep.5.3]PIJ63176.1 hypothetical protein V513_02270 [Mesotoga sp. H07.pep.5.3]
MKRTLMISTILILLAMFLASCMNTSVSNSDGVFELIKRANYCELFVAAGIDAFEITFSSFDLSLEDISPLQNILIIIGQDSDKTRIALSRFADVDFGKPVLRISNNSADMITVSEFDTVTLEKKLITFSLQEAVSPSLIGDYNGDGFITLSDFASFAPSYGFSTGSGKYDEKYDIGASQKQFMGIWQKIFSDLGLPDGSITLADFAVFANNYGFANPYLGTWTFTGAIDYNSSSFGQVDATGNGTATIESLNYNFTGNVTMSFEADYEDESGNPLHSEMTTTINNVSFDFDNLVMTIDATVEDPTGSGSWYDVRLRGALKTVGDAVYAQVPSGDIYLLNPERRIGTWSGSKQ